jgi:hypothetical protein
MVNDLSLEEGDFLCTCLVSPEGRGSFSGWVLFEHKSDFRSLKERIPGIRHLVGNNFESPHEAMSECGVYAIQTIRDGVTGL